MIDNQVYAMCPKCPAYITKDGWVEQRCMEFDHSGESDSDRPCDFALYYDKCQVYVFKTSTGQFCIVDMEDRKKVYGYTWRVNKDGHVETTIAGRKVFIHQMVLTDRPTGTVPDHIHGDKLDNRKSQLRPATLVENRRNTRKREGTSSQFLGVHWSKVEEKWIASIQANGKDGRRQFRRLGAFDSEAEAAKAFDKAAQEKYGDFAHLNFKDST